MASSAIKAITIQIPPFRCRLHPKQPLGWVGGLGVAMEWRLAEGGRGGNKWGNISLPLNKMAHPHLVPPWYLFRTRLQQSGINSSFTPQNPLLRCPLPRLEIWPIWFPSRLQLAYAKISQKMEKKIAVATMQWASQSAQSSQPQPLPGNTLQSDPGNNQPANAVIPAYFSLCLSFCLSICLNFNQSTSRIIADKNRKSWFIICFGDTHVSLKSKPEYTRTRSRHLVILCRDGVLNTDTGGSETNSCARMSHTTASSSKSGDVSGESSRITGSVTSFALRDEK